MVEVEVLEDGFKMFLNLDLKLKFLDLVVGALVEVGVGLVVNLSLLELNNLDLDLNKEEAGFLEKDLVVGLGLGVVEVSSSELGFLQVEG